LDTDADALPAECGASVVASTATGTRADVTTRAGTVADVLVDGVDAASARALALDLAPVRLLGSSSSTTGDDGLPSTVRLLDELGLAGLTPQQVLDGWRATGGRSTSVLLGRGADGPLRVDLRRDGPHALVAGTSGAGKSELLQSLLTSLALGNAPSELALVLVDYKGGAAFREASRLPHCAGLVTDLDGHLAERVLESLRAELGRRERRLAEVGAVDLEEYWARTSGQQHDVPRLVVVVDEFATLAEEVPEFVDGIVGIGMRGRSLGVHVVLATQRPGGVVTPDIRANVNLRICLRVTRPEDSSDVIDSPEAASISRHAPGRAWVRTGAGEMSLVQTARVAGPVPSTVRTGPAVVVEPRTVHGLGLAVPPPAPDRAAAEQRTDLVAVCDAVLHAAADVAPPARGPWLEPLPELVALPLDPVGADEPGLHATLGLADLPGEQDQRPAVLDLAAAGNVLVVGAVRSGRTTALRTLLASALHGRSADDVHVHVLDCGGRALSGLAALPHVGAVVDGDDAERTARLLARLRAEVSRRHRLLAAEGYGSAAEQRAGSATPLPWSVLVVDRWDALRAQYGDRDGGTLVSGVEQLLRDGPAVGLLTLLSSDRGGLGHRVAGAVTHRVLLRQGERDDWSALEVDPRTVPVHMPAGRALLLPGRTEVQVAVLGTDASGAGQTRAALDLLAGVPAGTPGPLRVDELPEVLSAEEAAGLGAVPVEEVGPDPLPVPVGAGGDELARQVLDLRTHGPALLVAGRSRSGRSTALAGVVAALADHDDAEVLVVTPRRSPLAGVADALGVPVAGPGPATAQELCDLLNEASGPVVLVVDDAELLADGQVGQVLEQFLARAADDGSALVAATGTDDLMMHRYRGWLGAARRGRCGLLLGVAGPADGEAFDLQLPRSAGQGWPPGRALLCVAGATRTVQLPDALPTLAADPRPVP
ncbi:FtsK/SpoIIIE domain-containing protein, partial [Angustibacter speluncae]